MASWCSQQSLCLSVVSLRLMQSCPFYWCIQPVVRRSEAVVFFTIASCLGEICFDWCLANKPLLFYFSGHLASFVGILLFFVLTRIFKGSYTLFHNLWKLFEFFLPVVETFFNFLTFLFAYVEAVLKLYFPLHETAGCVCFLGCVW